MLERLGDEYQLNKISSLKTLQKLPETVAEQTNFV